MNTYKIFVSICPVSKYRHLREFPVGPVVKTLCFPCRDPGFDPWLRNWNPTCHGAQPNNNNKTRASKHRHLGTRLRMYRSALHYWIYAKKSCEQFLSHCFSKQTCHAVWNFYLLLNYFIYDFSFTISKKYQCWKIISKPRYYRWSTVVMLSSPLLVDR